MAKANAGANQARPAGKSAATSAPKGGLLKRAGDGVAKAAAKVAKAIKDTATAPKAAAKSDAKSKVAKAPVKSAAKPSAKVAAKAPAKPAAKAPAKVAKAPAAKAPAKAESKAAPKVAKVAAKAPAKATTKVAKAEPKVAAKVAKAEPAKAPKPVKAEPAKVAKAEPKVAAQAEPKAAKVAVPAKSARGLTGTAAVAAAAAKAAERPRLRATPLPPHGVLLTRREMEQLLTAGQGRGVSGEGSLKGRLSMKDELPTLVVIGRDKRELNFVLQGPDQPLFPQYVDYRVSVSGLIRKTSNYAGTVDVRKYTAKRADLEEPSAPEEPKLRFLSPGEVTQLVATSMGAGMRGFASVRGQLEMNGEDYLVVLSNAGTRHQVSFILTGKNVKGMRKLLGRTVEVQGVIEKSTGWGGRVEVESVEPRASAVRKIDRKHMKVISLEQQKAPLSATLKRGEGLSIKLQERPGFTWAIDSKDAKSVALREVHFEPVPGAPGMREFFFTPRNPGTFEFDFLLSKVLSPPHVESSYRLNLTVRP